MRKLIMPLMFAIVLFGCQKEELTIRDTPQETSFLADLRLVELMQSVSSHDGTFDDAVDNSECFSIDFPYSILLNGEQHAINSINDLLVLDENDVVEPIFPLDITFSNYIEARIVSNTELLDLQAQCDNGLLYNERIICVDFLYPISVAVYNSDNSDFETISFNHDKDTFTSIVDFENNVVASINFPVSMVSSEGDTIVVETNEELKNQIIANEEICL